MGYFYVSPTGSDTTGNGSSANPYLTIAKAVSILSSGDEVLCKDGTYLHETIVNTDGKNVTIRSESNDFTKVVLSPKNINDYYINISRNNVVLRDITIRFDKNNPNGANSSDKLLQSYYYQGNLFAYNCFFYSVNWPSGVSFYRGSYLVGQGTSASYFNKCTFYNFLYVVRYESNSTTSVTAYNTIFWAISYNFYGVTTTTKDYNCYYSSNWHLTNVEPGVHSLINIDPKLVSTSSAVLQEDSPCIDAGGVIDGVPEIYGGDAPDIGCSEIGILSPPSVSTVSASNITTNSTTLNGELTDMGTSLSVLVWFEYWIKGDEENVHTTTSEILESIGTFYADITGLESETTYVVKAAAQDNSIGSEIIYGEEVEFTTLVLLLYDGEETITISENVLNDLQLDISEESVTCTEAENILILKNVLLSDSGTGTETPTEEAILSILDNGILLLENISITANIAEIIDSSTSLLETLLPLKLFTVVDAGIVAETIVSMLATIAITENSLSIDTPFIVNTVLKQIDAGEGINENLALIVKITPNDFNLLTIENVAKISNTFSLIDTAESVENVTYLIFINTIYLSGWINTSVSLTSTIPNQIYVISDTTKEINLNFSST